MDLQCPLCRKASAVRGGLAQCPRCGTDLSLLVTLSGLAEGSRRQLAARHQAAEAAAAEQAAPFAAGVRRVAVLRRIAVALGFIALVEAVWLVATR